MDDSLRHARHRGNPEPNCAVCVAKAEGRHRRAHQTVDQMVDQLVAPARAMAHAVRDAAGVHVLDAESATVRAVGGYVQSSTRFIR